MGVGTGFRGVVGPKTEALAEGGDKETLGNILEIRVMAREVLSGTSRLSSMGWPSVLLIIGQAGSQAQERMLYLSKSSCRSEINNDSFQHDWCSWARI